MKEKSSTPIHLGILGGGQLSRMLAEDGAPLGLTMSVLTGSETDPAAQVCGATQIGSLNDFNSLKPFLAELDAVTFESEFINADLLKQACPPHVHVFPAIDAIEIIQDRLTQKALLDRFKIPTSPWIEIRSESDLAIARERFPKGFVLKKRRFGYDGYGTFIFKNGVGDSSMVDREPHGFIAEEWIPFRRELAFSVVRAKTQGFVTLPLVESVQQNARCFSVKGPVQQKRLAVLDKAVRKMMNALDYRGILAIEVFETAKGELLVNELAPRVHNSAHYSQNALTCSQFEYHIRAGLDWPLPKVELVRKGFAMVNLLGEGGEIKLSRNASGFLHWYGKVENRPGRKLGHINTLASTAESALKIAQKWRKDFKL